MSFISPLHKPHVRSVIILRLRRLDRIGMVLLHIFHIKCFTLGSISRLQIADQSFEVLNEFEQLGLMSLSSSTNIWYALLWFSVHEHIFYVTFAKRDTLDHRHFMWKKNLFNDFSLPPSRLYIDQQDHYCCVFVHQLTGWSNLIRGGSGGGGWYPVVTPYLCSLSISNSPNWSVW